MLWAGTLAPSVAGAPPDCKGKLNRIAAAHGSHAITGTAWVHRPGAAAYLLTTGCDGHTKAWKTGQAQVAFDPLIELLLEHVC